MNRSDFLIIGGGIAGTSAGARLVSDGTVNLLEAEASLSYHSSGRSAAMFAPNYGNETIRKLNRMSTDTLMSAENVLRQRDVLVICGQDDEEAFEHLLEAGFSEIEIDQACDIVPLLKRDKIVRAGQDKESYDIDVDLLIQNHARAIRAGNGKIHLNSRVASITKTNDDWVVDTGKEQFSAPVLINASGAWADQTAEMAGLGKLGLKPMRRSIACVSMPIDVSKWPLILGASETWYAKPDAGNLLISPAEEEEVEPMDAWAEDMMLAEGIDRFQQYVDFEVTRVDSNWAGLRTFAPDRTPVVGFDPRSEGFFWLAGQGGYGVQTSPAMSMVAYDLATEKNQTDSDLIAALSPARFLQDEN